jgi:hypothetical protein
MLMLRSKGKLRADLERLADAPSLAYFLTTIQLFPRKK